MSLRTAESHPPGHGPGMQWARPRAIRTALALGALLVLYLAFETGRYDAGYSILSAMHQRAALQARIAKLNASNRTLQAQVVRLETLDAGHRHEVQVVTQTISDLQARIARQSVKLAFYRNILAKGTPPIGLRIGEVRLSSGKMPLHFVVHLSLLRADRPDGTVSGTVDFSVAGEDPNGAALSNQSLTGRRADLAYRFRYYQQLQDGLVLPPGFRPAQLTVTVRSSRKDIAPLTQTYPWSAISTP